MSIRLNVSRKTRMIISLITLIIIVSLSVAFGVYFSNLAKESEARNNDTKQKATTE